MSDLYLVGLCGRSGTGKGYVCKKFLAHGIPSVDTDAVYRTMTGPSAELSPCMQELVSAFGEEIVLPDGALDRRVVSALVFGEGGKEARLTLNRITHKHILTETLRIAEQYTAEGAPAVIVDAPLLFESGFDAHCACTVCVTAPDEVSVRRITERDGISPEDARRRLAAQIPAEELIRRCDYRIENDLYSDTLEAQVADAARDILARRRITGGGQ